MRRWLTPTLIFLVLSVAAVTRFAYLGQYSYFFDEAWNDELSTARGSLHIRIGNDVLHEDVPKVTSLAGAPHWWRVWTNMDYVVHPPLFILALRGWRDLFGEAFPVSRALSATLSVLAVLLMFDIGRLLHGARAALWASLIMALSGAQILLAQEVRPYALLSVMGLASLSALVRIEKFGPTLLRNLALGACVLGMLLTHYFACAPAASIGLYVLIRLRGRARRDAMIALISAATVFAIAWGPFLWQQRSFFAETADNWLKEPAAGHVRHTLTRLASDPLRLLIQPANFGLLRYPLGIILVMPFFLLRRRPEMLLWCVWICGTILFIAALDFARSTQHLAYIRYTLLGGPAIYITLATLIAANPEAPNPDAPAPSPALRRWLPHLIPACVALACAAGLPDAYREAKPEYRLLASYLDNNVRPGDVVVFNCAGSTEWYASVVYLNTSYYARSYPWPFAMLTRKPDEAMLDRLRGYQSVWLLNISPNARAEDFLPGSAIDGYEFFPFVCTAQRVTPYRNLATTKPIVPPTRSATGR